MKKISCFALICSICLSLCVPTFAVQPGNSEIIETVAENGAIIRTLYRSSQSLVIFDEEDLNFSETKADLIALGIDEVIVEELSVDELLDYASGEQITTVEQYIKSSIDGSNVEYLSKEEALAAVAKITINDRNDYEDQYIKVTSTIVKDSDLDVVLLSADMNWLTEPAYRGEDTLGVCAEYVDVIGSSRKGFIAYTTTDYKTGTLTSTRRTYSQNRIQDAGDGTFYGSGMIFTLPQDIAGGMKDPYPYTTTYSNFYAHFTFKGRVKEPEQRLNFNVIGTYTHKTKKLVFEPSVSLSVNPYEAVASISPKIMDGRDAYHSVLEVTYTP